VGPDLFAPAMTGCCEGCGQGDCAPAHHRTVGLSKARADRRIAWRRLCVACAKKARRLRVARARLGGLASLGAVTLACIAAHYLVNQFPSGRSPWRDTAILVSALVLALASLFAAYERGGRAWAVRFSVITDGKRSDAAAPSGGAAGLLSLLWRALSGRHGPEVPKVAPGARVRRSWVFHRGFILAAPRSSDDTMETKTGRKVLVWRRCVSGFWGEALLVVSAIAVCLTVVWQAERGSIVGCLRAYPEWIYPVILLAAFVVADYSVRQVDNCRSRGRSEAYCQLMGSAYAAYGIYSWLLFAFGTMIFGVLGQEFMAFAKDFQIERGVLANRLADAKAALAATPVTTAQAAKALALVERAYGRVADANIALQRQMNPVFLFAALLITLNIVITHTRLKQLFANDARIFTLIFTYVPLVLVGLLGFYVYKSSYESMMLEVSSSIRALRFDYSTLPPDQARRLQEIIMASTAGAGLFGFVGAVSGSGSGAAVFIWFLKEALDRSGKADDGKDIGRRPKPRFRPV